MCRHGLPFRLPSSEQYYDKAQTAKRARENRVGLDRVREGVGLNELCEVDGGVVVDQDHNVKEVVMELFVFVKYLDRKKSLSVLVGNFGSVI